MKLKINAVLTTKSPMHIAAPESGRYDPDTGYTSEYGTNGFPCTLTQKMSIATEGETTEDGNSIATIKKTPVIAANNIAGRLRRHAAKLLLEALREKDQKVSIETYSALMCGAVTSKPDSRDTKYAEYLAVKEHPYLGLFGGGPRMYPRNVKVHNALPMNNMTNQLASKLVHPHAADYAQNGLERKLLKVSMFRRNDDLHTLADIATQEKSIEDFEKVITARQTKILAERAKGKDNKSETTTFTFSALELIVPNVNFATVFELDVNDNAQVGLFLLSLSSFAQTERIGGQSRNGFGMFEFNDVIITDDEGNQHNSIFNNGELNKTNPEVAKYISAWKEAAKTLEASDLETMYELAPVKEKKKATPADKKAA